MFRRHTVLAVLLVSAVVGCRTNLLEPSPQSIVGRWRRTLVPSSPTGQFVKTLTLAPDGHYTVTSESRGVYPTLPADSGSGSSREYGMYVLTGAVLHFSEDSTRTWDVVSGTSFHAGSRTYFEGPPTDPTVEITASRLLLRYSVNIGNGYVPVTEAYDRDQ